MLQTFVRWLLFYRLHSAFVHWAFTDSDLIDRSLCRLLWVVIASAFTLVWVRNPTLLKLLSIVIAIFVWYDVCLYLQLTELLWGRNGLKEATFVKRGAHQVAIGKRWQRLLKVIILDLIIRARRDIVIANKCPNTTLLPLLVIGVIRDVLSIMACLDL